MSEPKQLSLAGKSFAVKLESVQAYQGHGLYSLEVSWENDKDGLDSGEDVHEIHVWVTTTSKDLILLITRLTCEERMALICQFVKGGDGVYTFTSLDTQKNVYTVMVGLHTGVPGLHHLQLSPVK